MLFVTEDFWLIVVTEGNEDEAEIHDAQRARREAYANERAICIDTTAAGGNTALLALAH